MTSNEPGDRSPWHDERLALSRAGITRLVIAQAVIATAVLQPLTGLLRGTGPAMVILGPHVVVQYAAWQRWLEGADDR